MTPVASTCSTAVPRGRGERQQARSGQALTLTLLDQGRRLAASPVVVASVRKRQRSGAALASTSSPLRTGGGHAVSAAVMAAFRTERRPLACPPSGRTSGKPGTSSLTAALLPSREGDSEWHRPPEVNAAVAGRGAGRPRWPLITLSAIRTQAYTHTGRPSSWTDSDSYFFGGPPCIPPTPLGIWPPGVPPTTVPAWSASTSRSSTGWVSSLGSTCSRDSTTAPFIEEGRPASTTRRPAPYASHAEL
jgi:hypothetical protein